MRKFGADPIDPALGKTPTLSAWLAAVDVASNFFEFVAE